MQLFAVVSVMDLQLFVVISMLNLQLFAMFYGANIQLFAIIKTLMIKLISSTTNRSLTVVTFFYRDDCFIYNNCKAENR